MPTIVVFSHLRWDFVFQRPQHLLSRLAQHYPVLFVEEPVHDDGAPFMERTSPAPNVTVCRAHTPIQASGFHDEQLRLLQPMVTQLAPPGEEVVAWFYTPMALPLLQSLRPSLVVYDCMDELASFQNPPKQLLQRERALLTIADLVFAGGPSLYEAKRNRHPSVHCFSSSVDVVHFQQALDRSRVHPQQQAIPHPRLGFYGVLDERFDPELVGEVADAHPEWQIVLAGPVVKIDPERLPRRANIHYLGQQPYSALPDLLAGWDVCLMPFAINEATKFISPTKVLEYMAAQLPIVSTPIADVVNPYGHVVAIAHGPREFIAACEAALAQTPEQRARMVEAMQAVVAATSWDNTARRMRELMDAAPPHTERRAAPRLVADAQAEAEAAKGRKTNVNPLRAHEPHVAAIVVGAGLAGLAAAYHLGADTLVLDRHETVGGGCRSFEDNGFIFDHAGHALPAHDPYVLEIVETLTGDGARIGAPPDGGYQALADAFLPHIKGKIELSADVVRVLPREHIVALRDGRRFRYDDLVSTMPLPQLIKAIGEEAPAEVREAARQLRHVSLRRVNIGIDRVATDKRAIDYPADTLFHRIAVPGDAGAASQPPGGFGFTCEIAYSPRKPLPVDGDQLIARTIEECRRVGLIADGDRILAANQVDVPYAQVAYDEASERNVGILRAWLKQFDIVLAGSFGEWTNVDAGQALRSGRRAAEAVLAGRGQEQKVGAE